MTETTLLIDQGNTRLKWVLANAGEIIEQSAGHGDLAAFMRVFGPEAQGNPAAILFSSVADKEEARALTDFCASHWGLKAQLLESTAQRGGVQNAYPEPATLGVDRWLAIVGAVARYGKPVVIWDLGTAATVDAVDAAGQHLGGMIYPGPATMLRSLSRDTKLKVSMQVEQASSEPGRSTASCINNGVFAAQVGALNQFQRSVSAEIGTEAKLILTGGAASALLPFLDFEYIHDPWLVFRGMLID